MDHKELYKKIPGFECKPGCTDCCDPMQPFDAVEWSMVENKKFPVGFECPYKGNAGCEIYKQRPFICRLFGSVEGFECHYGYGPDIKLTKEQGNLLRKQYSEIGEKE